MRVLVTGGRGFIGGATVRRLLLRGDRPVVLSRRAAGSVERGEGVEWLSADLLGPGHGAEAVRRAAEREPIDAVVHCAGRPGPGSWRMMRRLHVDATRALIDAAAAGGARAFVHVASQAVLFGGDDLIGVGDDAPYPRRYIDPYSATKGAGERLALSMNGTPGSRGPLRVASIRPALVWGRGDTTVLPIMVKLARGLGIPMTGGGRNIEATTHVEHAVDGIVGALGCTVSGGKAYLILDGFEVTWKQFMTGIVEAAGTRAKFLRVPKWLAVPSAWALDRAAGALGLPVPLAYFGVRNAMTSRRFRPTRAAADFGYAPRIGWEEGLADLAAWCRERSAARTG